MKNTVKNVVAIALVVVFGFSTVAFASGALNGTWTRTEDGMTVEMTYNNGNLTFKVDGATIMTGTYTVSGNKITTTATMSGQTITSTGTFSISGKTLTTTDEDGETQTFTKK